MNSNLSFDAMDYILNRMKKIPAKLKLTVCASMLIGVIGHLFCYTNTLFLHDAAGIYWDKVSFAEAAVGSRWLFPVYDWLLGGVQLPWLDGLLTLLIYGISAWLVCEVLDINRKVPVILITGLMVLSPTAISSNCYLSSAPIYASALLFSCLAVYAFYKWKWGFVWFFLFAFICEGSYAAYIGFSICLFFMRMYMTLLEAEKKQGGKLFLEHVEVLIGVLGSLGFSYAFMKVLMRGTEQTFQGRISTVTGFGISTYLENLNQAIKRVGEVFLPGGNVSYMQGRPVVYVIFCIGMVAAGLVLLYFIGKKGLWKKPLCLLLLIVDLLLLPVGMNFFRLLTDAHLLMQFAFITPWLMGIALNEYMLRQEGGRKTALNLGKAVYSWIIFLMSVVTLYNWYLLANTTYAKEAVVYQSGISLAERLVERIESTEGYEPGVTPVVFIGDSRERYAPYHGGFSICSSITGIGSQWWDTSFTYNFPLNVYIQQHLGIRMNILNDADTLGMDLNTLASYIEEYGITIEISELEEEIAAMDSFPSQNSVAYVGDVLVVKFSNP